MWHVILIFPLLFFHEVGSMEEVNASPKDIVTVTRIPVDKSTNEPLVDNKDYRPITAAEAFTVFSIANLFLGQQALDKVSFETQIKPAFKFDSKQFEDIQAKLSSEDYETKSNNIL